ncbi:MAG: hypothetical protein M1607_03365 [Patescibacteria group bacterium]|nr:hypothetical protein [Patescibacteria group bacterium]MCL5409871.1 hypothetical protein [Patescibacteria group bacterium]
MDNFKPDPKDCLDIILTDIQLHTQKMRKPHSLGRQYAKVVQSGKDGGRAYSNDIKINNRTGVLSVPLGMEHLYDLARKKGKKYIRFLAPKDGPVILPGKDTVEKLQSIKKRSCKRN